MEHRIGLIRRLSYYPRNENGMWKSRPRVADYSRMQHCGGIAMAYESERLKTFANWPIDYVKPSELARCGFFYSPTYQNFDQVQCAFCRGKLYNWERGDDPAIEHRRLFRTCPFVLNMNVGNIPMRCQGEIAQVYITKSQLSNTLQASEKKYHTSKARINSFANLKLPIAQIRDFVSNGFYTDGKQLHCYKCQFQNDLFSYNAIDEHLQSLPLCPYLRQKSSFRDLPNMQQFTKQSPRLTDSERLVRLDSWCFHKSLAMGMPQELTEHIMLHLPIFNGDSIFSLEFLVKCILQLKKTITLHFNDEVYSNEKYVDWMMYLDDNRKLLKAMQALKLTALCEKIRSQHAIIHHYFNDSRIRQNVETLNCNDIDYHKAMNEILIEAKNCKVCFSEEVNSILIPCHHTIMCMECTKKLSTCPLCRYPIESILEINLDI